MRFEYVVPAVRQPYRACLLVDALIGKVQL